MATGGSKSPARAGSDSSKSGSSRESSPKAQPRKAAPSRLSFLASAFSRMIPLTAKAPPARSPTPPLCTPLPAAGFAAPSPATQPRPVKAASHTAAKSPVSGGKRRQQAEVVKTEPQQEEEKEEAQTRTQDSPPTKKHKAVKTEPGTEEEEDEESQGEEKEAVAMAASLVTQIGHNKVVNGIINHPRGFKQRIELLRDSTPLWKAHDYKGLLAELEEQGYIVLRGFLPRDRVLQAGTHARGYLKTDEGYDPDNPSNGLIALSNERPLPPLPGETGPPPDEAWKLNIKKDKRIWGLLESVQVRSFMDRLAAVSGEGCKAKVLHPAMTWVRVKGHKQFSKVHADYFYMKGDTDLFAGAEVLESLPCERCQSPADDEWMLICDECDKAYHTWCLSPPLSGLPKRHLHWFCPRCAVRPALGSLWVPLQDVSLEEGGLCVVPTSHRGLSDYDVIWRETELPASYFSEARHMSWHVGSYQAGDVVIFDWKLVHAATINRTQTPRISIDTRWSILPPRDTRLTRLLNSWGNTKPNAPVAKPAVLRTRHQISRGANSA